MREILLIAKKDLAIEFRSRESIVLIFILSFVLTFAIRAIFADRLEITGANEHYLSGMIWATFIFTAMLFSSRSFLKEQENNCLSALLLYPVEGGVIYLGKLLSTLFLLLLTLIFTLLLFILFFEPDAGHLLTSLPIFLAGVFSFAVLATFVSALSLRTGTGQGIVFIVLMVPFILYTIVAPSVRATSEIFQGASLGSVSPELGMVLVFGLAFFMLSYLLFDESVRVG